MDGTSALNRHLALMIAPRRRNDGGMHAILRPSRLTSRSMAADSIREVVFGFEDGVVQNMTLVAGMVGAQLSSRVIFTAASINAIAGVLSMSMGTYLSSQAERDVAKATNGPELDAARSPRKDALVMAGAYAVGAGVPLIPFVLGVSPLAAAMLVAVVLTAVTLFALGVLKGALSHQHRFAAGLQMLLLASAAGLAGFLLGVAARAVFGLEV